MEIFSLLFPAMLILAGAYSWQDKRHLRQNGKKANAILFKNNLKGQVYYPTVRFLTDKQDWITQELKLGYQPAKKEGTRLVVIYDPDDPTHVEIFSTFHLQILPLIQIAGGVFFFVVGLLQIFGHINISNQ